MIISYESTVWDSIIIGSGPAGLSAAVALGRSLRSVLVLDAGSPRNRFTDHMHTVLGHEGLNPAELRRRGREEAAGYGAEFLKASVSQVRDSTATQSIPAYGTAQAPGQSPAPTASQMAVTLTDGRVFFARSIIAASGLTDRLPEITGLAERWGSSVLHCPYCHGWEVRSRRLGVLASGPMALHQAQMLRQWSDDLTFFSAAAEPLDDQARRRLQARGVQVEPAPVMAVGGEGSALSYAKLADGRQVPLDALFTAGDPVPHEDFLSGLALERTETPLGSFLAVDEGWRTSHERVWAPGNLSSPAANVAMSLSAGTTAGARANMALISEDFDLAERSTA